MLSAVSNRMVHGVDECKRETLLCNCMATIDFGSYHGIPNSTRTSVLLKEKIPHLSMINNIDANAPM